MFAKLVINIEAPLAGVFHYHVPRDMQRSLRVGHLVEVEFGRRLAQGIIIGFDDEAPVADTKPIIALIDETPVVFWWQIELAQWLSERYLTPLNACLRLMLPPGLTRWADVTVDLNPYWDGQGRLTDLQRKIIDLLQEKGDLRGRQLQRALRKEGEKGDWQTAVSQLARRRIVRKASILDPPRVKPKRIRTATLIAPQDRWQTAVTKLGRANKQADILIYLLNSADPLPEEDEVMAATGAKPTHFKKAQAAGLIQRQPAQTIIVSTGAATDEAEVVAFRSQLPAEASQIDASKALVERLVAEGLVAVMSEPATVQATMPPEALLQSILALRQALTYYHILALLAEEARPVNVSDIYAHTTANLNHLRKLVKLDLIRLGSEEVWRNPLADRDFVPAQAPLLTPDQARVWGRLKMQMLGVELPDTEGDGTAVQPETETAVALDPFLLHGVTGSGKTEIYMRAIAQALTEGRRAIVLVPEIALTPQTVRRFAARFPGRVAILHSRLSDGERYDTWRRAKAGLFDILVGPRSALFSPMPTFGCDYFG